MSTSQKNSLLGTLCDYTLLFYVFIFLSFYCICFIWNAMESLLCFSKDTLRFVHSVSKERKDICSKERKHIRLKKKTSLIKAHLLRTHACLIMMFRKWRRVFPQDPTRTNRNWSDIAMSPWFHSVKVSEKLSPHTYFRVSALLGLQTLICKKLSNSLHPFQSPDNAGARISGSFHIPNCWNQIRALEEMWVIFGDNLNLHFRGNKGCVKSLISLYGNLKYIKIYYLV